MKPICIYHGGCDDGFGAAWAVRHALGDDVELHAGQYGREPPNVTGRDVILVDFSYKRPVLMEMAAVARSIVVLDHHKTAAEDLAGFPTPKDYNPQHIADAADFGNFSRIEALFDMDRSGAGIAWDFFHPGQERPAFINYLEDRDLWRKSLPGSDEFTIALRSHPFEFPVWDKLVAAGPGPLIEEGKSIQRYYRLRVEEFKRGAYLSELAGVPCMATNAPYFAASEVAGELSAMEGAQFGLCYFEGSNGEYFYSLRSRGDFDVSAIAKQFGGGGHKNAAGFKSQAPAHRLAGPLHPKDVDWHVVREAIGDCFDEGYIGSDKLIQAAFKSNGLIVTHEPEVSPATPS